MKREVNYREMPNGQHIVEVASTMGKRIYYCLDEHVGLQHYKTLFIWLAEHGFYQTASLYSFTNPDRKVEINIYPKKGYIYFGSSIAGRNYYNYVEEPLEGWFHEFMTKTEYFDCYMEKLYEMSVASLKASYGIE